MGSLPTSSSSHPQHSPSPLDGICSSALGGHCHPPHPLSVAPYPAPHVHPHPKPSFLKRAARSLARIPKVSGLLVLALCSVSFFFGRFVQQASLLPEPAVLSQQSHPGAVKEREAVLLSGTRRSLKAAVKSEACPPVDPYDLRTFDELMMTQLGRRKPALPPGASGENFYRTIPFQILSWYPRIMVFPNFIDRERAEHVIKKAQAQMYPSGLAYRPGEKVEAEQQVRTSTGTWLTSAGDEIMDWLEKKVAAASFLPQKNGEPWNVLNYKYSQHYDSHYDTFDPKEYGPQPSQRVATVIVYLSDIEAGGQTVFKREGEPNGAKVISNWTSCETDGGLVYKPRMGDAVMFWGTKPNGDIDPHALHGSCPVTTGDKWVAVRWIRNLG